jgi:hypothetical protein
MKNWGGWIIWGMAAFYSAVSVWLPEVRPYSPGSRFWTGASRKWTRLSCAGLAMAVWLPMLYYGGVVTGLLSGWNNFVAYLLILLGVIVAIIGDWADQLS